MDKWNPNLQSVVVFPLRRLIFLLSASLEISIGPSFSFFRPSNDHFLSDGFLSFFISQDISEGSIQDFLFPVSLSREIVSFEISFLLYLAGCFVPKFRSMISFVLFSLSLFFSFIPKEILLSFLLFSLDSSPFFSSIHRLILCFYERCVTAMCLI